MTTLVKYTVKFIWLSFLTSMSSEHAGQHISASWVNASLAVPWCKMNGLFFRTHSNIFTILFVSEQNYHWCNVFHNVLRHIAAFSWPTYVWLMIPMMTLVAGLVAPVTRSSVIRRVLFRMVYNVLEAPITASKSSSHGWSFHDDVIKWKHFPRNWPFVRGIHRYRWIPHTKSSDAEL